MSADNPVVDQDQRLRAIDPRGSFCVSAPAGSGKTELLIQRYLGLLARVQRPEQVLAITFTRKAAAEMRERVLAALHAARDEAPCESEHQLLTRELSRAALATDAQNNWQLLRNVARLNIKTIDSFCLSLTRQMPVLSSFGGQVPPQEDARLLYAEAVEELFALLDTQHAIAPDLRALLAHYDNDWPRLQQLLTDMLMRRQQWRMYLGVHQAPDESEAYLTHVVEELVRSKLHSLNEELAPLRAELLDLMRFAARNLGHPEPERFPGSAACDLPAWRALRQMLQTNEGNWRKTVNKSNGFPADKEPEPMQRKEAMLRLLSDLAGNADLEARLAAVASLPEMNGESDSWRLVLHLSRLLPVLAAQLLLVFRQRGVVDYNQVAEAALTALGEEQAPTELALRLDYSIEHILVDEFQDTSINQFELLGKLTRGWAEHNAASPDAPRTLLIVGDAMQSIYGFRDANVGLFLKAREQGVSGIRLQPLELRCNFRSHAGIVDWVNTTFSDAFPPDDDIARARVSYRTATAVRGPGDVPAVTLDAFCGDNAAAAEVAHICDAIARCIDDGQHSIAVLGRTRTHLHPVYRRLLELGVRCQAQELASLAGSPVVADLMSLCRALANDADRLAWLSLLRAPWCGLQLADLLTIARFHDESPYAALRLCLASPELPDRLSDDGRARLAPLQRAIKYACEKRDRLSLRVWIEQTWCDLGGPHSAADELALQDAESFMRLLEQADTEGVGLDIEWLQRQLDTRFMSGGDTDCPVQLLTLHKAKGLEFNCVFIPRLDGRPRSDSRDLLLWDEHSSASGERAFLLAASDHSEKNAPTLYNYLKRQRAAKSRDEATRLIYVGATRAIRQLHLSAVIQRDEKHGGQRHPPRQRCSARSGPLSPIR
ncbi:MAG: UvrD-helicase domain-containing protein [Halioglobus sp.]